MFNHGEVLNWKLSSTIVKYWIRFYQKSLSLVQFRSLELRTFINHSEVLNQILPKILNFGTIYISWFKLFFNHGERYWLNFYYSFILVHFRSLELTTFSTAVNYQTSFYQKFFILLRGFCNLDLLNQRLCLNSKFSSTLVKYWMCFQTRSFTFFLL